MKKAKSIKAGKSRKSQQAQSPAQAYRQRLAEGSSNVFPTQEIAARGVAAEIAAEIAEPTSPIAEHQVDRANEPGYVLQGAQIAMMALIWGALCFTVGAVVQAAVFGS